MSGTGLIRVVLVDDQELFRAGVAVVIGAQPDLEVAGQAADGRDGLEVIARTRPDVVLMDVRMPRMGGVEATRELFAPGGYAGFTGPRPRVVLLTTFEMDEAAAEAIRLGASGFLLKDTAPELLCSAIRAVHRGRCGHAGQFRKSQSIWCHERAVGHTRVAARRRRRAVRGPSIHGQQQRFHRPAIIEWIVFLLTDRLCRRERPGTVLAGGEEVNPDVVHQRRVARTVDSRVDE